MKQLCYSVEIFIVRGEPNESEQTLLIWDKEKVESSCHTSSRVMGDVLKDRNIRGTHLWYRSKPYSKLMVRGKALTCLC